VVKLYHLSTSSASLNKHITLLENISKFSKRREVVVRCQGCANVATRSGKLKPSLCITKYRARWRLVWVEARVVKGKVVPVLNHVPRHEHAWGSGSIAPRILNLGTRCRWVVRFIPRPLYPQGLSPWYPLDRRLSGPHSRSEHGGEEKKPRIIAKGKLEIVSSGLHVLRNLYSTTMFHWFHVHFKEFVPSILNFL
jgi:hypothetical protein